MKMATFNPKILAKDTAGILRNKKTMILLMLLVSLLLTGCSGPALSITSLGSKSTIEANNAEDGKYLESSSFSVGKGKTVTIESSLEKGQLKIEFAQAIIFRDEEAEQTIVEDVVASETVSPGDSLELSLEPGDYVMLVTVIGSTNGKVTVNIK